MNQLCSAMWMSTPCSFSSLKLRYTTAMAQFRNDD